MAFFFVNISTASSKLVTKSGVYLKNCSATSVIGGKLNKEHFLNVHKFVKWTKNTQLLAGLLRRNKLLLI